MRAVVVTGPGRAEVAEVASPPAVAGRVVVEVERAGVCGTDLEFFSGEMSYLHSGHAAYPMRLGHEWCGIVAELGPGVDRRWLGRRVTGDTMLGCGHCARCLGGRQHVCADRFEIGIRNGWPGALAERLSVPASALHALPDGLDPAAGALVEPGGNALRAVRAAALEQGERLLVIGTGTIGLLTGLFARAAGAEVHLLGERRPADPGHLDFARGLGFTGVWTADSLPELSWSAVVDASNSADSPARAVGLVEPGRRVVLIGLSGTPSTLDTRDLVLADVTAVGILSASPGLAATIECYASGAVDPRPLVAATVGLEGLVAVLGGTRPPGSGAGPKIHADPAR